MKVIMNTCFALCLGILSYGQYDGHTLFEYSESVHQDYENRYDSLPYQTALLTYFNELNDQHLKDKCNLYHECFFNLTKAEFLIYQGNYQEALTLLDNYLNDRSKWNPHFIDDYLQALLFKVSAESKLGNMKIAKEIIPQLDSILNLYLKQVPKSIEYKIRNMKARLFLNNDRYQEVESCLKPILKDNIIIGKTEAMIYQNTYLLRGELQLKTSHIDSAYYYFDKADSLLKQYSKQDHFEFVDLYIHFANYYRNTGKFSESENYLQKARIIFKQKIGEDHPDYANILRLLANLYRRTGQFDLADKNYNESLRILKKSGFEDKTKYAIALTNQGIMFTLIGKRKEAEQNFLRAKTNMEFNGDTIDLDYVCTLEDLGNLYYNQLRLNSADSLYSKTLQIRKNIQGEQHSDYAECLNSLGNIQQKRENYALAESYYERAIHIVSDLPLNSKKICPHFYNNLAELYSKTNQFEKAESLFIEVKMMYESQFGKMNRTYLSLLDNMAELYARMNNHMEATKYYIEASKLRKRIIYDSFKYLSTNEIDGFMQRFQRGIANFNNYLIQCNQASDSLLIEAFENELFYKGFLLNYHLELNNIIQAKPELAYLSNNIKKVYKSIAQISSKYPSSDVTIDSLEEIAHQLEKQLGRKMDNYKDLIRKISYEDLRKFLKPKEALIEIMYLNLNAEPGQESISYAAMIIPYGTKIPILVNLCKEDELNKLFLKTNTFNADYVNALYSNNSRGFTPIEKNKNGLYELIWKKLEPHLINIKTIYYSPAGLFHNINIQAIPINKQLVSGANYNIIQLTSSRQLLNIKQNGKSLRSALLMGGIQYDEVQNSIQYDNKIEAKSRGNSKTTTIDGGKYWPELSQTFREIYQLNDLFQKSKIHVKKYFGSDASEETFKKEISTSASPTIIHIATHGYFFPESNKSNTPDYKEQNCPFMNSKNPMMRSGLVLAFGNYGWYHCEPIPGRKEDGILTAFEISQMNLRQTQLAVLSACETGLGEIRGSEGVYGLQRAFKIAGVKYLVMSLWQIPDVQTEELMLLFYTNLLKHKMDIPKAFKKAQMDMKVKYNDPYFWAGFVLVQ